MPTAFGVYSWASGCGSYATGNYSTAFGSNATATGAAAQAFGVSALASGTASVAMGVGAEAAGESSVALGPVATAKGKNSLALGMGSTASNQDDVALGSNSTTAAATATSAGTINGNQYQYAGAAPASAVSIGAVGQERQLQNVAAGVVSQTSTDAVNGSQLFATNTAVGKVGSNLALATSILGGGAQISADGTLTGPEYQIQGAKKTTVGDALTALDGSVTSNASNLTNLQNDISNGLIGLVQQDATSKAITVAAASGGDSVSLAGTDGARTLSGIKEATLAADSTEAVTGSQLLATNDKVDTNSANIATNTSDIATNKSDIAANTSDIATNKTNIETNKTDIAANTADIATNTSAISAQGQTLTQHDGQLQGLTASLGGGAQIAADGTFSGPEYQIQGAKKTTVGDALTALDGSVTSNASNLTNLQNDISNGLIGLVQQDATSKAITVAAASGGDSVSFAGTDGARTLSGIKEGKLAADSTEAVTGSQLLATNNKVDTNSANIATNTSDIATNKSDIAANTSDIATNKTNIETNKTDIAANTADIATNTSAISAQGQTLTQHDGQLQGLTASLGGGAQIAADGTFTGPEYQIQGAKKTTVGDALTALDGSVTSNTSSINDLQNNISSGSVGLVQQDATSKAITVAATSGGNSVNFAGTDGARTLSGIKEGKLAADSTEAVTGSQLLATNDKVDANTASIATNTSDIATNKTDIAANTADIATNTSAISAQGQTLTQHDGQLQGLTASLGGGAQIAADGTFTGPEYQIQGAKKTTVGDALTALDGSVTSNTSSINDLQNNISSGSVGLVQQDATSKAITVAATSGGNSVNFAGTDGARTLSGIKEGKLAADSTEAVTGSQLLATNDKVDANTASIATNTSDIATNKTDIATSKTDIAANTADIATNTSAISAQGQTLTQHDGQLQGLTASLGGGAQIAADGTFTGPEYQIQGAKKTTVGDALTALDGSVTSNTSSINDLQNNISSGSVGLVQQDATSKAITVAAASGGNSVNFAGTDGARTLSGIKEGKLAADSTEAVTGSQLLATNDKVDANTASIATNTSDIATNKTDIAANTADIATNTSAISAQGQTLTQHDGQLQGLTASLGGGAQIAADGTFSGPEYQIQGAKKTTVGDALTALDGSVTSNTSSINDLQNNISSGSVGLVQQDATSKAITVAATSGGNSVNFAGTDGARTLSGIKEGKLAADSTEAVTGSQLLATNDKVDANTASIATNTSDIATNKTDIAANTADIATNTSAISAQGQTLTQHDGQLQGLTASLGGGAQIAADGTFSGPEYQIQGAKKTTVGDALTALDGSVTSNTSSINDLQNNISSGSVGLVQQDATSKAITVAATSGGNSVNFAGTDGVRTLSGIKEGKLAADSTEAVTGSQLLATNDKVDANTASIATNTSDIATNKTDIATNTSAISAQGQTLTQHNGQLQGLTASLGGGAQIAADGTFTGPEYQVQGSKRTSVGDALTALDGSVTSNTSSINDLQNNISSGSVGLVQQDATSKAITVAATSGGNSVNFAGTDGARTLSGIKEGKLAADSTEAVTGSQLFNTNSGLSAAVASLGGGAIFDASQGYTAPTYTIQGQKKNNVGDALYALDGAVSVNSSLIGGLINGSSGLVRQPSANGTITIGSASGGKTLDVSGTQGNRVISGVANGAVNANSHEAVNGSQLYETNQQVAQNTSDIGELSSNVKDVIEGKTGLVQQSAPDANVAVAGNSGGSSVSVNGTDGDRRITGVSNGVNDNDAATVGQLNDMKGNLGDGAMLAVNSDKTQKPTAAGKDAVALGANAKADKTSGVAIGSQASSQGERAIALGEKSQAQGEGSLAMGSGSKATGKNSVALGSNSSATEDNVVSLGSSGNERRMTNLARGINASDAATVGQMNDGFASLQNYTDRQVNHLNKRIGHLQDKLTAGVASAMALSGIPQAYQPDSSLFGAAGGSYGGASAIAVGMSHISENGRWITKLQASGNSQSDFGGTVGIGYQW
ncbi:hypothetical protein TUM12370_16110 [Salmonella enterica subsp. enterica serovar Choleraesuis]|nr:hypothetical protein TUM12370_16110 [Salmonella enterica subsp. enterica serovar Choleraesuis]